LCHDIQHVGGAKNVIRHFCGLFVIRLHIVAPSAKREKVFQEIRRPVFSLLEKGPLADSCTYLSYDSLRELGAQKHLSHLSDTVLDEYAEEAE
jgi:hypothetical protein